MGEFRAGKSFRDPRSRLIRALSLRRQPSFVRRGVMAVVQEGSGAAFGQPAGANGWTAPLTMQVAARVKF